MKLKRKKLVYHTASPVWILLCLYIAMLMFLSDTIEAKSQKKSLTVAVKDFPPCVMETENRYTGLDVERWEEIANDLADLYIAQFGQQRGHAAPTIRATKKRQKLWEETGVMPRGIDREVVEALHRTHIGVDNDPVNLILQGLKASIADGWGGSMVATEISDILFGTPSPVAIEVNMGVLKEDQVNIIVHGHEPNLFESMLVSVTDPMLVQKAKDAGFLLDMGRFQRRLRVYQRHGRPCPKCATPIERIVLVGRGTHFCPACQAPKDG